MREPLGILDLHSLLTPEERASCDTGLRRGYRAIPAPTTGLHLVCYGALALLMTSPVSSSCRNKGGGRQPARLAL